VFDRSRDLRVEKDEVFGLPRRLEHWSLQDAPIRNGTPLSPSAVRVRSISCPETGARLWDI